MSGNSNRKRAARLCTQATGVPYRSALEWAEQGRISRTLPVPDAFRSEQRAFEAWVALVGGESLKDSQLDGAVMGFTRSLPTPDGLVLQVHTPMAERLLAELMPRVDVYYGGLRGVPGLRVRSSPRGCLLRDLAGGGEILLHGVGRSPRLPVDTQGVRYVGRRSRRRLHALEVAELADWTGSLAGDDPVSRDRLLSRLLRRPRLVNLAAEAHGWANSYCHQYQDMVLEWCCGQDASVVKDKLLRSGLDAPPDSLPSAEAPVGLHPGTIALGGARIYVRRIELAHTTQGLVRTGESIRGRYV
ncbi:hypothetical protein [Streptomyces sp. NPDC048603]|uniref:hypothetical protein n=1 Tax=Streptomyces sp. NPDC048603 TaxID=3365577 RepID=UPI00371F2F57